MGVELAAWPLGEPLPDGARCGDCARFRRCRDLIERGADEKACNWSPSRFEDAG